MTKAKRYDTVVLLESIGTFQKGEKGAVVEVYTTPYEAYDIEIVTNAGKTQGLAERVRPEQLEVPPTEMVARIVNRGRGPELEGTRVTVYRIMDFVQEDCSIGDIATALHLTEERVRMALDYIALHRQEVEAEYHKILQRVQQRNSPQVEAGRATSPEALKQ